MFATFGTNIGFEGFVSLLEKIWTFTFKANFTLLIKLLVGTCQREICDRSGVDFFIEILDIKTEVLLSSHAEAISLD